jgi:hypothetical protein
MKIKFNRFDAGYWTGFTIVVILIVFGYWAILPGFILLVVNSYLAKKYLAE